MSEKRTESDQRICAWCKKSVPASEDFHFTTDGILCEHCLDEQGLKPRTCPSCKEIVSDSTDAVGMLLTPVGSSREQKADALEATITVCPNCRILFFDGYNYSLIAGMKRG